MDKDGDKPKTYVSTFRLALRPQRCVGKQNGLETSNRTITGNSKTAADVKQTKVQTVEAPRFKEPLRDCLICDGGDATFHGVITGSEPMRVSWLHNGVKVNSGSASFKTSVACLNLTRCSRGNAGVYTCVAENSAGKRSSSGVLQITGAATNCDTFKAATHENSKLSSTAEGESRRKEDTVIRGTSLQAKLPTNKGPSVLFLDPPEKVEARVGEQARLKCEFKSSSLPVACCWIYNKRKVVVGGPRTSVQRTGSQSSVEISEVVPEDAGSYTIVVQNRLGSAQHTVSLSVVDRPTPPSSQPIVSRVSTKSLVLSWTGPSYDGGTAVLGYIVEVSLEVSNKPGSWIEISRCENTSYHINSGLEPLGRYWFRVRAYNSVGISEPSRESECVKMATTKEKKGEPESYVPVTIDTKHKVRDHYNVHEKLGVGKFGEVYRLTHKETGQESAAKFYRARTSKDKSAARKEIQLMNKLQHPKIVQSLAAYDTRSEMAMVMEYIAGGELFERIVDDHFEHTEPTSARYMQQILEGMQYVHKQNIIHLDLKPENIVCVDPSGTRIKIIDFGLAAELEKGKPVMVMHGTPEFVAPEVVNYEPVGLETDMWSIGVICFILLSGESPFQGNNDAETLALVTAADFEFDPESFEDISDEAKDFISSLLKKDRRARLSCTEALAHSWMASFTPLNRRPTKSLRKDKMKHFLARRKWKKTGQAVLALKRIANLSSRPDSPGGSSEGNTPCAPSPQLCLHTADDSQRGNVTSSSHSCDQRGFVSPLSDPEPAWSREAEEAIRSLDKQLQSEPRFQRALKDASLPKGATAELTCLVDGHPQPEVKWLHNGELLSDSSRATMQQLEDGLCSLVLVDLTPSDSGVYVCRAKNQLGEAMCAAKLHVEL